MGRGSSPGHVLHCFLLALHTNLAADEAKLGVWCCARTGGGHRTWYKLYGSSIEEFNVLILEVAVKVAKLKQASGSKTVKTP